MLKFKDLLWIVFAGVLTGSQFAKASEIREDIAVVRICNTTDPVDLTVFNTYMMHHDFDSLGSHSKELPCFLLCIFNQYKWMDRHGNFRIHKIKLWMQRQNLSLKNRELYKCATTADLSDPCTRARHFTECFWTNHQGTGALDDDNETLDEMIRKKITV